MKKALVIIFVAIIAIAVWYGYREYTRTNKDLKAFAADIKTDAPSLIDAFQKDSSKASKTYTDKIVSVTGNVKKIDSDGNPVILFLGSQGEMSSVKCSMDSLHSADYKLVKPGTNVTVKGRCTGGESSDLFGTDVTLNFCVLEK